MKRLLSTFLIVGSTLSCSSSLQRTISRPVLPLSEIPQIGQVLNNPPESSVFEVSCSSCVKPSYEATIDGIPFTVAIHPDTKAVVYVATSAPTFSTPEGVKVGVHFWSVADLASGEPIREPGWGEYVCFPSGWCGYLSNCSVRDEQPGFGCEPIDDQTDVVFLFKRGDAE